MPSFTLALRQLTLLDLQSIHVQSVLSDQRAARIHIARYHEAQYQKNILYGVSRMSNPQFLRQPHLSPKQEIKKNESKFLFAETLVTLVLNF